MSEVDSQGRRLLRIDMNRVEGDLEIRLALDGNTVMDAWCVGTMYRGYEQILVGRTPQDAMVITPRICGICSTSQLYAATAALESAWGVPIAPNGTRIRNLCLMAEAVMSDARHTFLMFTPDLCNPAYAGVPLYDRMLEAFEPPFKGRMCREAVLQSKAILGVVIAFGGQWPHSTYMLPGGVTVAIDSAKLRDCLEVIDRYSAWYESKVLGCTSEEWLTLDRLDTLLARIDGDECVAESAVGLFTRFARAIGLHRMGQGSGNLLSGGCYYDPDGWQPPFAERPCLMPAGFYDAATDRIEAFDAGAITEDLSHAWFADPGAACSPWDSTSQPRYDPSNGRYSFAKATRYRGQVAQLGPLADLVVGGDPLISDCFLREGPNVWLRQLARLHRPVALLADMRRLVLELERLAREPTLIESRPRADGDGFAAVNAARGTLAHWVRIRDGRIANYQVITPTTWNASPRDGSGRRGHWEESFVGLELRDPANPIEIFHLVRSHDACLVCTVHFADRGAPLRFAV